MDGIRSTNIEFDEPDDDNLLMMRTNQLKN